MLRRRTWLERGTSSICASCRLQQLYLHPYGRRLLSNTLARRAPPPNKTADAASKHGLPTSNWGEGGDWGSFGRAASGSTTPATSKPSDTMDGLLPHERAAKEQAMRNAPPPLPQQFTKPSQPKEGLAPFEKMRQDNVTRRVLMPQQRANQPGQRNAFPGGPGRGALDFRSQDRESRSAFEDQQARNDRVQSLFGASTNRSRRPAVSRTRQGFERDAGNDPNMTATFSPVAQHSSAPNGSKSGRSWDSSGGEARANNSTGWGQLRKRVDSEAPGTPEAREQPFWAQARDQLRTRPNSTTNAWAPPVKRNERSTAQTRTSAGQNNDVWAALSGQMDQPSKPSSPRTREELYDVSMWEPVVDLQKQPETMRPPRPAEETIAPVPRYTKQDRGWAVSDPDQPFEDEKDDRRARNSRFGDGKAPQPQRERKSKGRSRDRFESEEDDFEDDLYEERRQRKRERKAEKERQRLEELENGGPVPILLPQFISVLDLATALKAKPKGFLSQLEELGFEDISLESIMTGDTAALVAQEYGYEPTVDVGMGEDLMARPPPEDPSILPPRPPVVTIMGHVDHGKTTLLDFLRKSSVAAQEHGGITQHIGAFSVKLSSGKQITFLDTPGHAAFLTMRQRGANVTDMVILVVAADDSVKPQTIEALKHAQAAKVPIIVAINKVDKEEARVDQVKADLSRHGVEIEDFGGEVPVVCVSGKTGQGMEDLEENILTLAEVLDMRAEQDGMAEGWVLESSIKPIGRVATVLVKRGTLRQGDLIVAGKTWTRIRNLRNEAGVDIKEAPPSTPVEILGWGEQPDAGDEVLQAPDEGRAKDAVRYRQEQADRGDAAAQMIQQEQARREKEVAEALAKAAAEAAAAAADDSAETVAPEQTGPKIVHFIIKGDVHGSVEAVVGSVMEIGNNEVQARILRSSPGHLIESDLEYAATSGSIIINFNNPIPGPMQRLAEVSGVKILNHNIIYHLVDDVKKHMSQYLSPEITFRVTGEAEILQVFPINVKKRIYKNIAGCRVRNGAMTRGSAIRYRVIRNGKTLYEGPIAALKQGKKDVSEMRKGNECGIMLEDFEDFEVGDQLQAVEEVREQRHL